MYQPSALSTLTPAFTHTLNASANTPSGAAHNTQRTMVTMTSASVWNKSTAWARRRASTRVSAKPNSSAHTTSGNIAPCAAAAMTLLGMIVANRCGKSRRRRIRCRRRADGRAQRLDELGIARQQRELKRRKHRRESRPGAEQHQEHQDGAPRRAA